MQAEYCSVHGFLDNSLKASCARIPKEPYTAHTDGMYTHTLGIGGRWS